MKAVSRLGSGKLIWQGGIDVTHKSWSHTWRMCNISWSCHSTFDKLWWSFLRIQSKSGTSAKTFTTTSRQLSVYTKIAFWKKFLISKWELGRQVRFQLLVFYFEKECGCFFSTHNKKETEVVKFLRANESAFLSRLVTTRFNRRQLIRKCQIYN